MTRKIRALMLISLIGCMLLLIQDQALSQPKGPLPPRPPIYLNNNASLYTFPNPNAGLPSQLPFAFVAVAHEDCRLFNNGAKLMPKHRLLAAECIQGNGMNPNPPPPGCVCLDGSPCRQVRYLGGFVPWCPAVVGPGGPGGPGTLQNGINYGRPYQGYGGVPAGYTGNYGNYNPSAQSSLTTGSSDAGSQSRSFRSFGLSPEVDAPEFLISVGLAPLNRFGGGFGVKDLCCGEKKPETDKEPTEGKSPQGSDSD